MNRQAARALLQGMLRLEQLGTTLAFVVMVLVLALDIVGRELLSGGKIWAKPVAVYANVFIAFVGMGIASAGGAHLRPRFMDKLAPEPLDALFDRFTDVGFALFSIGAGWLCWVMLKESIALAETDTVLPWKIWPFQGFLVAGFAFAALRHGLYAVFPALRPAPAAGENAPPSEKQLRELAKPQGTATAPGEAPR